ncbi:hypothetical protein [Methylotetracoccus oryzae]|uniref:hypothetical protein n=1 Tax=Methylotetracoccus oryzae TaxID=1919059 RepID=UPI00111BCC4D|nr:hypothetical protein [Methylotetracoccus oryzae]
MTDELKAATKKLRTAREDLESTRLAQQNVKDKIAAQREAIHAAEAHAIALDEQAAESMESPEAAEAWRTARAKALTDKEGLTIQLQALETCERNCAETARRDKTRVAEAEAECLVARLEALKPQVREAFEVIADGAALHAKWVVGSPHLGTETLHDFVDWLFSSGVVNLGELNTSERAGRTEAPR